MAEQTAVALETGCRTVVAVGSRRAADRHSDRRAAAGKDDSSERGIHPSEGRRRRSC